VLTPDDPNGSPIGFRVRVQVRDQSGQLSQPTETTTYPVVDPASSFDARFINGYWALTTAGKAYAVVRAEDGDGTVDERLEHQPGGAAGVADAVDHGGGTAQQKALRSKVLTFYVNHAPVLQSGRADFYPRAGTLLQRKVGLPDSPAFNLPATDDDWYDPQLRGPIGGTPTKYPAILRWKLAIGGKLAGTDRDTCFVEGLGVLASVRDLVHDPGLDRGGGHHRPRPPLRLHRVRCAPGRPPALPVRGPGGAPGRGTCVDTDIPCQLAGPTIARAAEQRGP
jgi:hypothetical protein